MSARLDVRPLACALLDGLRHRAQIGQERQDGATKYLLFGIPTAIFCVSLSAGLRLTGANDLIAGTAVLIGALLVGFSQLASWRERLTARNARIDGAEMRMLDEAVAHVLVATLASGVLSSAIAIGSNASWPPAIVIASSLAASITAYLALSLLIVVNLLWLAYRSVNPHKAPVARPDEADLRAS